MPTMVWQHSSQVHHTDSPAMWPKDRQQQAEGNQQPVASLQDMPQLWMAALIREHLAADDRLQLFRASRGLAAAVLQHTNRTELHLNKLHDHHHQSTRQVETRWGMLMAMLADGMPNSCLCVSLTGGVPQLWGQLPKPRITHLTLRHMAFTAAVLHGLQLQQCTHLQSLSLDEGCVSPSRADADDVAALSSQRTALFPSTLTCLHLSDSGMWCEDAIDQLLGPQITTLHSHDNVPLSFSHLTHYHSKRPVLDNVLDSLCALPCCTHVTGRYLHLTRTVPSPRCTWQQLTLEEGALLPGLMHLPLQHIKCISVCRKLFCDGYDDEGDAAARALATCTRLQCVPQPVPGLELPVMVLAGHISPAITQLCAHSLTRRCCLCLVDFDPPTTNIIACIAQLFGAQHLAALGLASWQMADCHHTDEQLTQYWQQLVAALPTHITQVWLEFMLWPDGCCHHAAFLLQALASSPQHTHTQVVAVVAHHHRYTQQQLQQLMVVYAPRFHTVPSTMIELRY